MATQRDPPEKVVSLQPYVVTVDVTIELHLISMEATLSFGPFNSAEDADEWRLGLEREHKVIEGREAVEDAQALKQSGIPTKPFLRAYVHGTDVIQVGIEMRANGALIPPQNVIADAHRMHFFALRASEEAIAAALAFLENANDSV